MNDFLIHLLVATILGGYTSPSPIIIGEKEIASMESDHDAQQGTMDQSRSGIPDNGLHGEPEECRPNLDCPLVRLDVQRD